MDELAFGQPPAVHGRLVRVRTGRDVVAAIANPGFPAAIYLPDDIMF